MQRFESLFYRFSTPKQRERIIARNSSETLHGPRELNAKFQELMVGAREIKVAICPEWFYLIHLPMMFTPDTWEKVYQMMEASVKYPESHAIEITSPPRGTPSEIAEGWVGCTVPFSSIIHTPMVFQTPELEENGMISRDGKFYVVNSAAGLTRLNEHNNTAARAYRSLRPEWSDPGQVLIFNGDSCQVVPTS